MKCIKQLAGAILAAAVVFSMSIYDYAEENPILSSEESLPVATEQSSAPLTETTQPTREEPSSDSQEPTEETPVIVNTLDELQAAIETANDGDTIIIGAKIIVLESVTIGSTDKIITLTLTDDFSGNSMFSLYTNNNQAIAFQNLILDGISPEEKKVSAIMGTPLDNADSQGVWNFDNVVFENFNHTVATVGINNADATFSKCCFKNNYGKRSGGIEISTASFAEITDCNFSANNTEGNGAAIYCWGNAKIVNSSIIGNSTISDGTVRNGGGMHIADTAFCEVVSCTITDNSADLGGGIGCFGKLTLCDTVIFGNTGWLGGNDIRAFGGSNISVTYTDSMKAIYTENNPLGFYADDFENPFNAETSITSFVGEMLEIQNNTSPNFGVRFLFANDLPASTPTPTPEPDNSTENQPTLPICPSLDDEDQPPFIEVEPDYPEIEIVPIPKPEIIPEKEPVIQAPVTPDSTPTPTSPNIESSEPAPAKVVENIQTPEPSSSASIEPTQPQPTQEQETPVETSSDISDSADDIAIVSTDEDELDTSPLLYATIPVALVAALVLLYIRFKRKHR